MSRPAPGSINEGGGLGYSLAHAFGTGPASCSTPRGGIGPRSSTGCPVAAAAWAPTRTQTEGLRVDLELPDFRDYAVKVDAPGEPPSEPTRVLGAWLRDVLRLNAERRSFACSGPTRRRRTGSTPSSR